MQEVVVKTDQGEVVVRIDDDTPLEAVPDMVRASNPELFAPRLTQQQQDALESLPPGPTPIPAQPGFIAAISGAPAGFIPPLAPDFPDQPPSIEQRLDALGIEGGAGAGARFRESFAADPAQGAQLALEQQFGEPVQIFQRPELSGRITFINPRTGQEQVFNPPGFDMADIPALAGGATVVAPEAVGGVGGAVFGGPAGGVAGAAGGAGLGEAGRLQIGRALGVNPDLTAAEQLASAGREAAIAGAVDAATLGIGGVGRRVIRGPLPRVPAGVLEDTPISALQEGIQQGRQLQDAFRDSFGADLPLNTEQVLRGPAAVQSGELRGATQTLRGRATGEQLREQARLQGEAMESAAEQVLGPEGESQATGGRLLQTQARGPVRGAIAEQQARLEALDEQALRAEQISDTASIDQAAIIRDLLEEGRDSLNQSFDARYDALREAAGDVTVDLAPLQAAGRQALREAGADLFPSLAPENVTILKDAIGKGSAPFDVVQRALSDLRQERRLIRRNLSPRRNIGQINQLIAALEEARGKAMRGRPGLEKQVADLEADFATARQRVDRGMIGQLLQPAEGGGFRLRDDQVIGRMTAQPALARQMANTLRDPAFQAAPGALPAIREGILADMREKTVNAETGRMTKRALANYMQRNKTVIDAFFDPAEVRRLERVGTALGELETQARRMTTLERDLNRTFGMQLQRYDPSEVARRVLSGTPEDMRRARVIASRDPVAREEYRKAVLAEIRRRSTRATSSEPGRLDFTQLSAIAENPAMVDELGRLMGPRWRRGFEVLTRALDTTRMRPTNASALQEMQAAGEPGSIIQGILRVTFPPLTREGRALTGAMRTNRERVMRAMDRVLADPEMMAELAVMQQGRSRRNALNMLTAIGLGNVAEAILAEE